MFAKNSEASFVFNGVTEFIKAWESGSKTKLTLQSKNGLAWLNFSCCLGGPHDEHQKLKKPKSKKKRERDNLRAQLHQQRLQDGLSSSNLPKSDVGERAASALKTTTNSSDINTKDPVQADSTEESTPKVIHISDSLNESRNDSIEIEVVKDKNLKEFKCELCDFVSNKERGLNIHMSRVHTKIEQIDGVLDESQLEDKQEQEISEREEESDMMDNNSCSKYDNVSTREFIDAMVEKGIKTTPLDARQIDQIHRDVVWNRWELKLRDINWQRMFENNRQINLFPLCLEFFQQVKQDMDDEILFHMWLACQKRKYPHHLAYQKIEL